MNLLVLTPRDITCVARTRSTDREFHTVSLRCLIPSLHGINFRSLTRSFLAFLMLSTFELWVKRGRRLRCLDRSWSCFSFEGIKDLERRNTWVIFRKSNGMVQTNRTLEESLIYLTDQDLEGDLKQAWFVGGTFQQGSERISWIDPWERWRMCWLMNIVSLGYLG